MTDDFIHELRGAWQSQDHDVAGALQRLRRNRWTPHLVLAVELTACVLAFSAGAWFAWMALRSQEHRLLFALSAAVVLITAPALGVASVVARRRSLAWDAEGPESILRVGVRRVEASLRAVRIGYWHVAVVTIFVGALWIAQTLGLIRAIEFLVLYTVVSAIVCVASWIWMVRRTKQLCAERAAYAALLAKLQADEQDDYDSPEECQL